MTDILPPYNEYSVCVKCGTPRGPQTKPLVEFCRGGEDCKVFPGTREHLHRSCQNCGYLWAEDALPEDEQQRLHEQNVLGAKFAPTD